MTSLSLLELNPRSSRCRKDVRNLQAMHQSIMSMFPDISERQARQKLGVLWRIEPTKKPTLLIQSKITPQFCALPDNYASTKTKNIDKHLSSLKPGSLIRYRTTLNPVRSSRTDGKKNTQTVIPFSDQPDWWKARAERIGLVLEDDPILIGQPTNYVCRINGQPSKLPIYSTRVDGFASVRDAEVLRNALVNGVGRAKAWGCGLLTVIHASL